MHPRRKGVPPKIPPHMRLALISWILGCGAHAKRGTGRRPNAKWPRRGPWGEPLRQRRLGLPPSSNPSLCRRRKSANQPKLTDDQLTSTMSPTLNFDSVLDRTERRRRRLMVALLLYRYYRNLFSSSFFAVRVFFVRTSSQVEINHSGAQYSPELLSRNRQKVVRFRAKTGQTPRSEPKDRRHLFPDFQHISC